MGIFDLKLLWHYFAPLLIIFVFVVYMRIFYKHGERSAKRTLGLIWASTILVCLVIAIFHTVYLSNKVANMIYSGEVEEIQLERIAENSSGNKTEIVGRFPVTSEIHDGLMSLKDAEPYKSPRQDRYDGYVIRFRMKNSSEYSDGIISIFRFGSYSGFIGEVTPMWDGWSGTRYQATKFSAWMEKQLLTQITKDSDVANDGK
ncbi:MAG: hypothetical protein ACKVT0_10510 [Planctomycetaceae bacterium]